MSRKALLLLYFKGLWSIHIDLDMDITNVINSSDISNWADNTVLEIQKNNDQEHWFAPDRL